MSIKIIVKFTIVLLISLSIVFNLVNLTALFPKKYTTKIIISDVIPNSAAAKSDLRGGDIVTSLDNIPTVNIFEFQQDIWKRAGKIIALRVERAGQLIEKEIPLPLHADSQNSGILGINFKTDSASKQIEGIIQFRKLNNQALIFLLFMIVISLLCLIGVLTMNQLLVSIYQVFVFLISVIFLLIHFVYRNKGITWQFAMMMLIAILLQVYKSMLLKERGKKLG